MLPSIGLTYIIFEARIEAQIAEKKVGHLLLHISSVSLSLAVHD
jgi:hypothetical protein